MDGLLLGLPHSCYLGLVNPLQKVSHRRRSQSTPGEESRPTSGGGFVCGYPLVN